MSRIKEGLSAIKAELENHNEDHGKEFQHLQA